MRITKDILLGVNIDHVATLRQARGTRYPEPVQAALIAEQAGADSITLHLREDRRHIQERDLELIKQTGLTRINLEMAAVSKMVEIAERIKPADCCLVPEKREELTTEGGLDVVLHFDRVKESCQRLRAAGIRVSLFIEADPKQIEAAARLQAPVIEIHTGHFADAVTKADAVSEWEKINSAVSLGKELGLQVNAGHGLNYQNVNKIAEIEPIYELNIGHAIIARALFTGLDEAVRTMKRLMIEARQP